MYNTMTLYLKTGQCELGMLEGSNLETSFAWLFVRSFLNNEIIQRSINVDISCLDINFGRHGG